MTTVVLVGPAEEQLHEIVYIIAVCGAPKAGAPPLIDPRR